MTAGHPSQEDHLQKLRDIVAQLRGEHGCPWDRKQTLQTLKPYLIEETYELIDAIDSGSLEKHEEELGDVLLQVVLQSRVREEQGDFSLNDVARRLCDKLVGRHPHVFGDLNVSDSEQVLENWEQIKKKEKGLGDASLLDGIPRHIPALQKAQRIQSRVARVGFDWEKADDVVAKVEEEVLEVKSALKGHDPCAVQEEIGDLLFAVVNLCRFVDVQAEETLQAANRKFIRRFESMAQKIQDTGREIKDCTLSEMDAYWNAVKQDE